MSAVWFHVDGDIYGDNNDCVDDRDTDVRNSLEVKTGDINGDKSYCTEAVVCDVRDAGGVCSVLWQS